MRIYILILVAYYRKLIWVVVNCVVNVWPGSRHLEAPLSLLLLDFGFVNSEGLGLY